MMGGMKMGGGPGPMGGPPQGPPRGGPQMPPPRQAGPQMGGPPQQGGMQADPMQLRQGQRPGFGVRDIENQLMQAQMSGANPMEIGQLQLQLQRAQEDEANWERTQYLQEMQRVGTPRQGIGSGMGAPSSSAFQQDPFLAQLIAQQYGQGGGGGIRF